MSETKPSISSGRKFSAVWIIPLLALVMGASVVIHSLMTQGPTITLSFATAQGLEAGKTKIKLLNVDVGLVESVAIKPDLSGVSATVKLDQSVRPLLREDTRFWVVRARVGASGVSGLGTILAGAYIEMAPGVGTIDMQEFVGLEAPPLTHAEAPGLRLSLFSQHAGSVSTGDAVLYNGYKVGRVEAMIFDTDQRQAQYDIFVDAPFHELVDTSTRFWDASGISFEASAEGFKVRTASLESIILGGVAFGNHPKLPTGASAENGREFKLYGSYDEILENPYLHGEYYVVLFSQSIAGLLPGAPVNFRGLQVGYVDRLMVKERTIHAELGGGAPIPVLIYLEPARLDAPDSTESVAQFKKAIELGVPQGMRATLENGNLITGKKLISIDYFSGEEPAELGQFEEYTVIPTIKTGIARMETQVRTFLDTLNDLALEETVTKANETLGSLSATLNSANEILGSDAVKALPGELTAALEGLRYTLDGLSSDSVISQRLGASANLLNETLENIKALTRQLSIKPNSIIFPSTPESDPIPEAKSR